jgi:hypothetical protein
MTQSNEAHNPETWPELAVGLFDQLTRRNAEITYEFENLNVQVPSRAGDGSPKTRWAIDGTLRIRTRDDVPRDGR